MTFVVEQSRKKHLIHLVLLMLLLALQSPQPTRIENALRLSFSSTKANLYFQLPSIYCLLHNPIHISLCFQTVTQRSYVWHTQNKCCIIGRFKRLKICTQKLIEVLKTAESNKDERTQFCYKHFFFILCKMFLRQNQKISFFYVAELPFMYPTYTVHFHFPEANLMQICLRNGLESLSKRMILF